MATELCAFAGLVMVSKNKIRFYATTASEFGLASLNSSKGNVLLLGRSEI